MPIRQQAVNRAAPSPARSPAGDAFSALVFEVIRLAGRLNEAGDALAGPSGQTSARWQVMAGVEHEPSTVARVARQLGLARQSVQRVADNLTSDGLTAYEDNPADRRAQLLRLTPRGRTALAAIQKAQRAWADELGERVGEAPLRRALATLTQVTSALGDDEE